MTLKKPRPRIKDGITCVRCGHTRFKFMKACPKCDYIALSELDTATKDLKLQVWAGFLVALLVRSAMALKA